MVTVCKMWANQGVLLAIISCYSSMTCLVEVLKVKFNENVWVKLMTPLSQKK